VEEEVDGISNQGSLTGFVVVTYFFWNLDKCENHREPQKNGPQTDSLLSRKRKKKKKKGVKGFEALKGF
jgi:hypothetical protein